MKTCSICNENKSLDEYYFSKYKEKKYYNKMCKKCHSISSKKWVELNKEKRNAIATKYRKTHGKKCNAASSKWRNENRDHVNAVNRKRRKEAPGIYRAIKARRRAAEIQAIPKWMTDAEWNLITEFYKNCPEGYEVDHILPLQGKLVRGFHCLANLQYLTKSENRKKSTKLIT